ncbi:hypothetical protein [Caenimonas sedimenti]|nr:hypothetical protein [Caenimonas sedimenti]
MTYLPFAAPVSLHPAHAILKEMSFLGTDGVTPAEVVRAVAR